MAQLGRFHYPVQDTSGNAIAGVSVYIYREGATVNGNQTGTSPFTVTVHDNGKIAAADTVFINTTTGTTYSVNSVTDTTVVLSGFLGGLSLTNGDRLIPANNEPLLYSDDQGGTEITNPLTSSSTGTASCFMQPGVYEILVSGSGVSTTLFQSQVLADIRTIEENVMAWGARGDGTTDDSAAIQAAMDDINSNGGGIVLCPSASYLLSTTLSIPSNVTLVGGGTGGSTSGGTRFVAANDSVSPIVEISGTSLSARKVHSGLKNLSIVGTGATAQIGIRLKHFTFATLDRVQFIDVGQAEDIDSGARVLHTNCNYFDCGRGSTPSTSVVRIESRADTTTSHEQIIFRNCLWEGDVTSGNIEQGTAVYINSEGTHQSNQIVFDKCKLDYDATNPTFPIVKIVKGRLVHFSHCHIGASTITTANGVIEVTGDGTTRASEIFFDSSHIASEDAIPCLYIDFARQIRISNDIYRMTPGASGTAVVITSNAQTVSAGPFHSYSAGTTPVSNSSTSSVVFHWPDKNKNNTRWQTDVVSIDKLWNITPNISSSQTSYTTELITISAATNDSISLLIPGASLIHAVTARIITTISGTGVTQWEIGDASVANRFISAVTTLTAGTNVVGLNHMKGGVAADASGPTQTSSAAVRITLNGSAAWAGAIRVTVFYTQFVSPTS